MKLKFLLGAIVLVIVSLSTTCENDPSSLTDKRDNITDNWHCTLDPTSQNPQDFGVTITKDDANETMIYLSNFVNNKNQAHATMTGLNITVAEQQVGNSVVSADGTVSSDYQSFDWTITIDGDVYTAKYVPGGITKMMEAK